MIPTGKKSSIKWIERTESTNSELRLRKNECDNLSIIAARCQTAGRGQGDHTWYSSDNTNLTFSILYRFSEDDGTQMEASEAILITCVTTLALWDYLKMHGITARIKWPNDIWVGDKKICGILIENTLHKTMIESSIVGIGLNINETGWPEDLPNPVSMKELLGRDFNLEEELKLLHEKICRRFNMLSEPCGRKSLQEEFESLMFRLHEEPK